MGRERIKAKNINELYPYDFWYDEIEECPLCHFAIQPRIIDVCYVDDMKRFIIAMVRYVDSELAFEEASAIEPK